ncbi:TPR repeat region-containing protein [Rhodococcus pyridinivorans]|uniref:TPR repeat region-containing protein n=1 Tax=Rhodococcus pyridinivorans TaxID=103816 RepID=UPI001902FF24|nr:hypothetical protein [Rhodococcus pyridinivorans]QQM53272.1 hypothetical protein JGU70_00320 [Rhodococcus pyridinivorans]
MLSPSAIRSLDPAALTTAADAVESANNTFRESTHRVDRNVDSTFGGWDGEGGAAAAARAWSDRVAGQGISRAVDEQVDALRDAANTLIPARATVVGIVDNAVAAGFTVHDDARVEAPRTHTGDAQTDLVVQAGLDDTAMNFEVQLKSAVRTFDELDRDAAVRLEQVSIRLSTFGGEFRSQNTHSIDAPDGAADAALLASGAARDTDLERIGRTLSLPSGASIEYLDAFYNSLDEDELANLHETYKTWEAEGNPDAARWADGLGNGLLILSNPEYGGSWESVPQDIRDTIRYGYEPDPNAEHPGEPLDRLDRLGAILGEANPQYRPGTEMGIEMSRVAGYMAGIPTYADPHIIPTPDPSYYDHTASTFLDIATRNTDTSYHLLTGTDVDGSPADFSRDEVLVPLLTREWADDGATLAGLTDWIAADALPADPGDPVAVIRAERAGEAAFGLAEVLSAPESEWNSDNNFNRFLHMPGTFREETDLTIGEVNPVAVRSFATALSPFVGDMVGSVDDATATSGFGELGPVPATRVFTLMNTDPAAGALLNGAAIAQATDFDRRFALEQLDGVNKYSYGTYSGRLQSLVEVGLSSTYENEKLVEQAAIDNRNQSRADAYAVAQTLVTGAVTALPGGVVTGPLVYSTGVLLQSEIVDAEGRYVGHPSGVEGFDSEMYLTETGAENTRRYNMIGALVDSGTVDPANLPLAWHENGVLKDRNNIGDAALANIGDNTLVESGIERHAIDGYLRSSFLGQGDLRNIVYADQRDGEDSFRDIVVNDVVPHGGERWNYGA